MLDEQEWGIVWPLYLNAVNAMKKAQESNADIEAYQTLGRAFCDALEPITGEGNDGARSCIEHAHRIAARGAPCPGCGKVLRTSTARQCFECGWNSSSTTP